MQSFYGGKSGFSFIIVKSFSSLSEMIENFKRGPVYTAVHYDEHVIINTKNKNNPDNGRIYRRGYEYTNDFGGAIYIGTIVGPAGRAPVLELATIEQVKSRQATEKYDRYTEGSYSVPVSSVSGKKIDPNEWVFMNSSNENEGISAEDLEWTPMGLVPGKDGESYNDSIKWACCCVRNENNEDSTAYIGFEVPYTVIDFTAKRVSPYNIPNNLIDRTDDKSHPFYERWNVNIPDGVSGDSFKDLRIMIADSTIQYDDEQLKQDDIASQQKVLVYDYYHYDKKADGEPVTKYLGPFYDKVPSLIGSESDPNIDSLKQEVTNDGIWFITED